MPTLIARLGREKTLATLAKRLFHVEGVAGAERKLRQAERALLRANPKLAHPDGFSAGLVVVVPPGIGLAPTERVTAPAADLGGTLDEATLRLKLAEQRLEEAFTTAEARREATRARLKDRKTIDALRKLVPESADLLQRLPGTLQEQETREQARRKRLETGVRKAISELDRLRRRTR